MDQRTIIEELMDKSGKQPKYSRHEQENPVDYAYRLFSEGEISEAEKQFKLILKNDPSNREAATGLRMVERQHAIEARLEKINLQRSREEEARAIYEAPAKKAKSEKKPGAFSKTIRSKKFVSAAVIAFVLVCAATAAALGITEHSKKLESLENGEMIVSQDLTAQSENAAIFELE